MSKDVKSILRKQILSARKILQLEVWQLRNDLLKDRVLEFINKNDFQIIHSFLPIEKNKEIDTWPIIKDLIDHNKKVVISITDFESETMSHFFYDSKIKFRLNRMKIPEPIGASPANIESIQMMLIPLITADKKGNRIGYGKGYYDRLLEPIKDSVVKVGVSMGSLFDSFPFHEPHDIKLDYCITPHEIVKCNHD